jgi:hypothetical protein
MKCKIERHTKWANVIRSNAEVSAKDMKVKAGKVGEDVGAAFQSISGTRGKQEHGKLSMWVKDKHLMSKSTSPLDKTQWRKMKIRVKT